MTKRLQRHFGTWILHHALEFKWFYLGAFACLVLLQMLQAEIPQRIRVLTEFMQEGRLGEVSVWIFIGLAAGILLFRTFSRLLFFYPARVQQKLLRMELLSEMEKVPTARYEKQDQGQLYQVLYDDINQLRAFIGFGLLQVSNIIIAAVVLIPKVNQTDSYLWPAFSPLFFSIIIFTVVTFFNERILEKMIKKKTQVQQFIIESYEAKQSIKNFHQEENFIQGFKKLSGEELGLFFKVGVGYSFASPYIKFGLGLSLLWASILIRQNGGTTSDLVFFSGFLYLFMEPVMFLSWVAIVFVDGIVAWKRVKGLFTTLITETEEEKIFKTLSLTEKESSFESEQLFWGNRVNLNFKKGKWTCLVGETGCGKTYLLSKVATQFILMNKTVSMVQQEPYLFNDTIRENIFLGSEVEEKRMELAKQLLQVFQLDSLESSIDQVLDLEVGENGKRLSGGQMKRVALVRSLLSGADILIWDDPFSSVDIILEKKIISRIKGLFPNTTFLISSHRLTTVKLSDELIYLEAHKVIEVAGPVSEKLKDKKIEEFFSEQLVDLSLS